MTEINARKIHIIGIVAGGKTTLARRLSAESGIAWHELDAIVHSGPAGKKLTPEKVREALVRLDAPGHWITEGTPRESCRCLLDFADCVIFLDPPLWRRYYRIVRRFIRQRLGLESCGYEPSFAMLRSMFRWTRDFERTRAKFEASLLPYSHKLIRAKSADEIRWAGGLPHDTHDSHRS